MVPHTPDIVGLVLAGGLARRMGGQDKALLLLNGKPLVAHVLAALGAPARRCAISANGDIARFAPFDVDVLPDADESRPGPLEGILSGLRWARGCGAKALLSAPVDCPFLPADLAARLAEAGGLALAHANGRDHPTVALWPCALAPALAAYLARGERRMMGFIAEQDAQRVHWHDDALFLNLNTPEDLARAQPGVAQPPKT